jgi:hypothetical protein
MPVLPRRSDLARQTQTVPITAGHSRQTEIDRIIGSVWPELRKVARDGSQAMQVT